MANPETSTIKTDIIIDSSEQNTKSFFHTVTRDLLLTLDSHDQQRSGVQFKENEETDEYQMLRFTYDTDSLPFPDAMHRVEMLLPEITQKLANSGLKATARGFVGYDLTGVAQDF